MHLILFKLNIFQTVPSCRTESICNCIYSTVCNTLLLWKICIVKLDMWVYHLTIFFSQNHQLKYGDWLILQRSGKLPREHAVVLPVLEMVKLQSLQTVILGQATISGVARTSPMLGHNMGTLHLYELLREVWKLLGESVGILPSLPSQFWGPTVAKTRVWDLLFGYTLWYCAIQFQDRLATDSRSTTPLSALHWLGMACSC